MTILTIMIILMIMTMMGIISKMRIIRIMRCLITGTNASFFSQASAQGTDSDLTAIATTKVFCGVWVEHYEGPRKVFYAVMIRAKFVCFGLNVMKGSIVIKTADFEHYMNVVLYRILTALFVISDSFYPLSRHETNWTSKLALIKSCFAHHTSKLTIQCNPFPTGVYEKHFSPHTLH